MDRLDITALDVGHGDAILIEWTFGNTRWTGLIDGGSYPDRLAERLEERRVGQIDLLILTHLDKDHIGGLTGLASRVRVSEYWGPALPAFKRHEWLFGTRIREAIRKGEALEEELLRAGATITYPLEGYASEPIPNAGRMMVLSPPGRLLRHLLTDEDVTPLLTGPTTPLGWLLTPEPDPDPEEQPFPSRLRQLLARNALTPDDLREVPPARPLSTPDDLARSWARRIGSEPEFFGDSLTNDSCLVVYLEARTEDHPYRVLLPGDQENWTWLLARHPRGLHADVLKATHHGGRVNLEADPAENEVLSAIRPAVVLVSANGEHNLPRDDVRHVAQVWGATIVCTSRRGAEYVVGAPEHKCCHEVHRCTRASTSPTITLDAAGIRVNDLACHSGYGRQPGPVIQLRQHVVVPSAITSHLLEHELRRHIDWVRKKLAALHADRRARTPRHQTGSEPVSEADLATLAREEGRETVVPHLGEVLAAGMSRGAFWAAPANGYRGSGWQAYALPDEQSILAFLDRLGRKVMILFPTEPAPQDVASRVNALETCVLAEYADAILCLPLAAFRAALWPRVTRAFKSADWHAYRHRSKALALSRHAAAETLIEDLLRSVQPLVGRDGAEDKRFPDESLQYDFPVLVSGRDGRGEVLDWKEQIRQFREWTRRVHLREVDPGARGERLLDLVENRFVEWAFDPTEDLTDAQITAAAGWLAKTLTPLW